MVGAALAALSVIGPLVPERLLGLCVHALEVVLEVSLVYSPLTPAADFHSPQLA